MDQQKMKEQWIAEGKPGYIIFGGITYAVHTPDGDEKPVFTAQSDFGLYGTTSTSKMAPTSKKRSAGNVSKNVTDIG